jgi:hypothetical protein
MLLALMVMVSLPAPALEAGKSYVIFGKTDTDAIDLTQLSGDLQYAIDYLGNENANTLIGTSGNEIFVAGAGDDTLIGNGGMDVFNAGATIISSTPSPMTSPAVETEMPLSSPAFSPLITTPPVPLAISDRLIAVLLVLPKTT